MATTERPRARRHWGHALFAASLAAWIWFFGVAVIFGTAQNLVRWVSGTGAGSGETYPLATLAMFAIFGIPVVLIACLATGVPALILAEVFKLSRWWQAASMGAAVGALILLGLATMLNTGNSPDAFAQLPGVTIFMLTGACAGVGAWASLWLDGQSSRSRGEFISK